MVRLTELLTLQSRSRGDVRGQTQLYETHSSREMIEVRGAEKADTKGGVVGYNTTGDGDIVDTRQ